MAADESTSPTDQRTLRHKILSFRPEAPLGSSNDAGEADVTRWAISSSVCVPNPEGSLLTKLRGIRQIDLPDDDEDIFSPFEPGV
jgi:hypothetical protein